MIMRSLRCAPAFAALALVLAICACESSAKPRAGTIPVDIQRQISSNLHPALHNTVGEFCTLVDATPIPVEGYGLVGPLPNTGSGDMDPRIREMLINAFVRRGVGLATMQTRDISPEAILASNQVAAVEVRGIIPPLARKGTTFDLYINAVPGSQTTSLANGLLLFSDLKVRGFVFDGTESQTIAQGRGPVYIPSSLEQITKGSEARSVEEAARDLRNGRILGGGALGIDRPARLQLYTPSARYTRMIEYAINNRFQGRQKAATAENDSIITLNIPPEFADDPMQFVDRCRHLYLETIAPGFAETRARELIDALKTPGTPHRDLSLALQGLGASILNPYIRPQYLSPDPELRFWCARAGACMQDVEGMTILQEFIRDPGSPYRRPALLALIEASRGIDTARGTMALVELLRSNNTDERILAYHALLAIRSRAITTYSVGRKFLMDILPADSPPLIYILQGDSPRIAFIGRPIALNQGALFISKDTRLTISADEAAAAPVNAGETGNSVLLGSNMGAGGGGGGGGGTNERLPAIDAPAQPAKPKENVTLYWRSPFGDPPVLLRATTSLPAIVARATWVPDPRAEDYDAKAPFIGASYQRITEMLASMCADHTIDATFIAQKAPELIVSPTDLALSGRPEGSTQIKPPPTPPPGSTPEAGAPPPGGK